MMGDIGAATGEIFDRITGQGDYKVSQNALLNGSVPRFAVTEHGIRIRHSAPVGGVFSHPSEAGGFYIKSYHLAPAVAELFPLLSTFSKGYEEAKFHGAVFAFKSESGSISSTQELGAVVMSAQYNVLQSPFQTRREMEAHEYSRTCCADGDLLFPIECDPKFDITENLFTGHPMSSGVEDIRFHSKAIVSIATTGCSELGARLGTLYVSYDVELKIPKAPSSMRMYRATSSHLSGPDKFPINPDYVWEDPKNTLHVTLQAPPGTPSTTPQTLEVWGPVGVYRVEVFIQNSDTTTYTGKCKIAGSIWFGDNSAALPDEGFWGTSNLDIAQSGQELAKVADAPGSGATAYPQTNEHAKNLCQLVFALQPGYERALVTLPTMSTCPSVNVASTIVVTRLGGDISDAISGIETKYVEPLRFRRLSSDNCEKRRRALLAPYVNREGKLPDTFPPLSKLHPKLVSAEANKDGTLKQHPSLLIRNPKDRPGADCSRSDLKMDKKFAELRVSCPDSPPGVLTTLDGESVALPQAPKPEKKPMSNSCYCDAWERCDTCRKIKSIKQRTHPRSVQDMNDRPDQYH